MSDDPTLRGSWVLVDDYDALVSKVTSQDAALALVMAEHTYAVELLSAMYYYALAGRLERFGRLAEVKRYLNGDWTPDDAPEKGGGDAQP